MPPKDRLRPTKFDFEDGRPSLRAILDHYDQCAIGCDDYRQGKRDIRGKVVKTLGVGAARPLVGPEELHLWTPLPRRMPVGLRNEEDMKVATRRIMRPFQLELNGPAIVEAQASFERKRFSNGVLDPAVEGQVLD